MEAPPHQILLDLFGSPPAEPLKTSEVADELDVSHHTARDKLDALADQELLGSKRVDASERVWWPVSREGTLDARWESDAAIDDSGSAEGSRIASLHEDQQRLLRLVAAGTPLDECITAVCDTISDLASGVRASVMLADEDYASFQRPIAPELDSSWDEGLEGVPINDLMIGTCGEAVFSDRSVSCENIRTDDRWSKEWRELCLANGIRAGHSEPLRLGDGTVEGSLMLCFDEPRTPTQGEQRLADFGTFILSTALERDRAERARRESEERFRAFVRASADVVYRMNPDWNEMQHLEGRNFLPDTEDPNHTWVDEYIPPDEQRRVRESIDEAIRTKTPFELEHQVWQVDGSRGWTFSRAVPITDDDGNIIEWIGTATDITERKERERELRQQRQRLQAINNVSEIVRNVNRAIIQQPTRRQIEQEVYRGLTESDSYAFAWIAHLEGEDVVSTVSSDIRGEWDGLTDVLDDPTGWEPITRAVRTGELQVTRDIENHPGYESADDRSPRDVTACAVIPVTYEDSRYCLITVYTARERAFDEEEREVIAQLGEIMGLATAAIEHEQKLAHERERLEFVNRLVRHNLLNSLNVAEARAEILDGHVEPDFEPHLETVRDRTENMIDLIQTLRSLMDVIVQEADHELEPVDLDAVLADEVEHARQAFPRAEFETQGDIEAAGPVLADDLLGAVFENVLTNSVQHNDKDVPKISVDVERGEETTTVHFTDNGPGVPDEMKERIFQKGEKGFDSPGTGFGLHLVQEIVDAYGGTISAEDNTPEGAVFTVSLPRPEDTR